MSATWIIWTQRLDFTTTSVWPALLIEPQVGNCQNNQRLSWLVHLVTKAYPHVVIIVIIMTTKGCPGLDGWRPDHTAPDAQSPPVHCGLSATAPIGFVPASSPYFIMKDIWSTAASTGYYYPMLTQLVDNLVVAENHRLIDSDSPEFIGQFSWRVCWRPWRLGKGLPPHLPEDAGQAVWNTPGCEKVIN